MGGNHEHDQEHSHGAGGHGHSHAPADFGRAFLIGIVLNIVYVATEATYGFLTDSMALLADAGHNLSDVLGLMVAWAGATLAKRPPSQRYTYGMRSSSILAALANALLLLIAVGAIAWEAIRRFSDPPEVPGGTVMLVAAVGILINGLTAWLFASGRKGDVNIRGAYLHMVADAAVSAAVVVAGFLMLQTGARWIDPAISLLVAGVIVWGTWGLLRDSVAMALHAVPPGIDPEKVEAWLANRPGVAAVHDLHIWPISTTEAALTAHLTMPGGHPGDAFLAELTHGLDHDFGIGHATVQVEINHEHCTLQDPATV